MHKIEDEEFAEVNVDEYLKNLSQEKRKFFANVFFKKVEFLNDLDKTLIESLKQLETMSVEQLYAFSSFCHYFLIILHSPLFSGKHYQKNREKLFNSPEGFEKYLESGSIQMIGKILALIYEQKRCARGIEDSPMNPLKQSRALSNSLEIVNKSLKEYEQKDYDFIMKLNENLENTPLHTMKKLMKDCGLNYTNDDRNRYIILENMILLPVKLRKLRSEGRKESTKLEESINSIKFFLKKYSREAGVDFEELYSEKKCLDSLMQVNKNQMLSYVSALFFELYDIEPSKSREFYLHFFTNTADKNKTNFMKETYRYLYIKHENQKPILVENLPCPFGLITSIHEH